MLKLSRNKPNKNTNFTAVPEYLAKGRLKETYDKTKQVFNVPWMGVVAMAFSHYPNFYNSIFSYMKPLSKSREFNYLCKNLVIMSKKSALKLKPKSILDKLEKKGYNNLEVTNILNVNNIFTKGNMPYLILATLSRIFLEKGDLRNNNKFSINDLEVTNANMSQLILVEEHHAEKEIKAVYNSIKKNLGLPFINTDYRAFARWSSYFSIAWKSFLPSLHKKQYDIEVLKIHDYVVKNVLLLPNPKEINHQQIIFAANKDKKLSEIKKVVKLFQWLLPGLILNVAFMREQLKK